MEIYTLDQTMTLMDRPALPDEQTLVILSSDELVHPPLLNGLEATIQHTPLARDVRMCKAEIRRDCLTGTLLTPRKTRDGKRMAFGYLLTPMHLVLCDDSGVARSAVKHLVQEKQWMENSPARFLYEFSEFLLLKDPHHLEELEDHLEQLEDQILSGALDHFSTPITTMRKEAMNWVRYYAQFNDMVCELEEEGVEFFSQHEQRLFRMLGKRLNRLQDEAQWLREYCLQVHELYQSEVDIRQNRIMKILTVVTTLCLPLSLVAGWYGMNFAGMPELKWQYGYPAVIAVSILIFALCLWIMKKKRFW